jgi:hypothetical protein
MVILNAGTLHWVRSLGLTTQTAWNFAPYDINQLIEMERRYTINKKIGFKTIIPFKNMLFSLLNHA